MPNDLALTKNPQGLIESLLASDPRLISQHTTRQYKSDLLNFDEWRAGRDITKTLVEAYAAELLSGGYAPASINQKLAAIRWYARKIVDIATDYSYNKEIIERAARVAQVEDVKGETPERGRHIEQGELAELLRICTLAPSPAGTRDAAIFALAWSTGLRRDEICKITLADLHNRQEGSLDILIPHGKGNKPRTVYIENGALSFMLDWLALRGQAPGRLFVPVTRTGKIREGKLSGEALRKMLDKRSKQAALAVPITWHDFRRTFAGNLWDAKTDGVTIQKLMGHSSQDQTAKYDRRPEATRRAAIRVLHVPYRKARP